MPQTAKLLLISDTHGVLHPDILALGRDMDAIVHAGDVGSKSVIASLHEAVDTVHCVLGNNDTREKWSTEDHAALEQLPPARQIELPGGMLAVEHGHRANPVAKRHAVLRRRYPDARLVVYGHSHRFIVDRDASPWVVNPGAAGRSRTFGGPSCILLTIRGRKWELTSHRFSW